MNIVLLTAYFPPETGSAAHLFYELGGGLVKRGHKVTVITSLPSYYAQGDLNKYKGKQHMVERMGKMKVVRTAVPQLPRHIPVARAIWQFSLAYKFALVEMRLKRPDVVLVYSPPLPLALSAWWLKKLKKVPFTLNVQDLFPQCAIDLGVLKNRLFIRFFEGLEHFSYKKADHITVHSPGNYQYIIRKHITSDKVTVLPNWLDTDFIKPRDGINSFREEHQLENKFIVSFAGVLGFSQDLDVVLEAANNLKEFKDILFLIVGDGVEKKRLEKKARDTESGNIRFLPMQPRNRYPLLLYASDICLATLRKEVCTPVVPSKILSIMAAGKPVIACMSLNGDAPKIINEAQCGYALPAGDAKSLTSAIIKLHNSPQKRKQFGRNGRAYCEQYFSLTKAVGKYSELFEKLLRPEK